MKTDTRVLAVDIVEYQPEATLRGGCDSCCMDPVAAQDDPGSNRCPSCKRELASANSPERMDWDHAEALRLSGINPKDWEGRVYRVRIWNDVTESAVVSKPMVRSVAEENAAMYYGTIIREGA